VLAEACAANVIVQSMVPVVMEMANDKVANVRFNVAKTIVKLYNRVDDTLVHIQCNEICSSHSHISVFNVCRLS